MLVRLDLISGRNSRWEKNCLELSTGMKSSQ